MRQSLIQMRYEHARLYSAMLIIILKFTLSIQKKSPYIFFQIHCNPNFKYHYSESSKFDFSGLINMTVGKVLKEVMSRWQLARPVIEPF